MEPPSSDGLEVVEPSRNRPLAPSSTRPHLDPRARSTSAAAQGARSLAQQPSNIIELGDSSDDELPVAPGARSARLDDEDEDDEVVIVGGSALDLVARTKRPFPDPSSEDSLPAVNTLWGGVGPSGARAGAQTVGRSASLLVGTSTASTAARSLPLARAHTLAVLPDLSSPRLAPSSSPHGLPAPLHRAAAHGFPSSSPAYHAPPFAPVAKAKGKARASEPGSSSLFRPDHDDDLDLVDIRPAVATRADPQYRPAVEEDLWADILTSPGAEGKGKGRVKDKEVEEGGRKKKGKGKARALDGETGLGTGRKRSASAVAVEDGQEGALDPGPQKKASRKTTSSTATSAGPAPARAASTSTTTAGLSKTALKKLETADRVRLREANTLRAGDKKASTAELTMHVSGRAFLPDEVDADVDEPSRKRPRKKAGAAKGSPWLDIVRDVRERLAAYACDVEEPDRAARSAEEDVLGDLDVEGSVRWTRVCDRVWSDERRMFVPLRDGEHIVVEEDSRLVFLSALDLSTHVANSTLSSDLSSIQARLPPHVNLFVLVFGLGTLFRDMERARQEAYRNSVRGTGGEERAVKPAGIGERQPSKDELELALMRAQIESRCMIVSVDKASEAADWLEQLTFDVGQKPYQRLKHSHVALLGTSEDKVQSGKDLQDTYIKLLASLPKVTEPVAKGIVAEYPTLRELYEAWEACEGERERREMLVGIGKGRNLDGTATHRAIGKDLSATVYRIMTSRDPDMFISK
ncbi:hypothetical protein JCM8208_004132 [Rhodotorula glutinis]